MKKTILICLSILISVAYADDTAQITASKSAADSIVSNRPYLSSTLGITVLPSLIHPDWVRLDFPLIASSGIAKRRIEATVRDLFAVGGEPAYRDSTVGSGYIRLFVPGRVYIHRGVAVDALRRINDNGVSIGDTTGAAVRDTLADGGWRLLMHKYIPGRF